MRNITLPLSHNYSQFNTRLRLNNPTMATMIGLTADTLLSNNRESRVEMVTKYVLYKPMCMWTCLDENQSFISKGVNNPCTSRLKWKEENPEWITHAKVDGNTKTFYFNFTEKNRNSAIPWVWAWVFTLDANIQYMQGWHMTLLLSERALFKLC